VHFISFNYIKTDRLVSIARFLDLCLSVALWDYAGCYLLGIETGSNVTAFLNHYTIWKHEFRVHFCQVYLGMPKPCHLFDEYENRFFSKGRVGPLRKEVTTLWSILLIPLMLLIIALQALMQFASQEVLD